MDYELYKGFVLDGKVVVYDYENVWFEGFDNMAYKCEIANIIEDTMLRELGLYGVDVYFVNQFRRSTIDRIHGVDDYGVRQKIARKIDELDLSDEKFYK